MGVKIKINAKGIKELEDSDDVHQGIRPNAERILDRAIETAPVLTGAYRDGLHLAETEQDGTRAWAIAGRSSHDYEVEAKTGNLARALDAGA